MLTEDYIMRTINQTLAVILQALGLKKKPGNVPSKLGAIVIQDM